MASRSAGGARGEAPSAPMSESRRIGAGRCAGRWRGLLGSDEPAKAVAASRTQWAALKAQLDDLMRRAVSIAFRRSPRFRRKRPKRARSEGCKPHNERENMKNYDEILNNSDIVTVVNDGQVRYPVLSSTLEEWTRENGAITTANYEQFCADVPCLGEREVGTPGSERMTALCAALIEDGSDVCRPPEVA